MSYKNLHELVFSAPAKENIFSSWRWSSGFCSASKANIYIPPSTFTVAPSLSKYVGGRLSCQKVCFRDASAHRNHKYSDCFFAAALSAAKLAEANHLALMLREAVCLPQHFSAFSHCRRGRSLPLRSEHNYIRMMIYLFSYFLQVRRLSTQQ